jgi:hypothetical protein
MPVFIGEGKLRDVWLAIRDHGAQGQVQIAQRSGWPATQIGPILFALIEMGAVCVVRDAIRHTEQYSLRDGSTVEVPARRYASTRSARWI